MSSKSPIKRDLLATVSQRVANNEKMHFFLDYTPKIDLSNRNFHKSNGYRNLLLTLLGNEALEFLNYRSYIIHCSFSFLFVYKYGQFTLTCHSNISQYVFMKLSENLDV